jgi:hypothetical protein
MSIWRFPVQWQMQKTVSEKQLYSIHPNSNLPITYSTDGRIISVLLKFPTPEKFFEYGFVDGQLFFTSTEKFKELFQMNLEQKNSFLVYLHFLKPSTRELQLELANGKIHEKLVGKTLFLGKVNIFPTQEELQFKLLPFEAEKKEKKLTIVAGKRAYIANDKFLKLSNQPKEVKTMKQFKNLTTEKLQNLHKAANQFFQPEEEIIDIDGEQNDSNLDLKVELKDLEPSLNSMENKSFKLIGMFEQFQHKRLKK